MKVQAREIVRKARKVGHNFERGSWRNCAVGFLARSVGDWTSSQPNFEFIATKLGVKGGTDLQYKIIKAIERGFEDYSEKGEWYKPKSVGYSLYYGEITDRKELATLKRYYGVGRNIARLAGLSFLSY